MPVRNAEAYWDGTLKEGNGKFKVGSVGFEAPFTWSSRFAEGQGTNPEELLGAAHAGCFSMSMSSNLAKAGYTPEHVHTTARVTIETVDGKNKITQIHLDTEVQAAGIENERFQEIAESVKQNCPVSVALASVPMTVTARLVR